MDAFKAVEIERMRLGGNSRWKEFFEHDEGNKAAGIRCVCRCSCVRLRVLLIDGFI